MKAPVLFNEDRAVIPLSCALCRMLYHEPAAMCLVSSISGCTSKECENCDIDADNFWVTNALMDGRYSIVAGAEDADEEVD